MGQTRMDLARKAHVCVLPDGADTVVGAEWVCPEQFCMRKWTFTNFDGVRGWATAL